MILLEKFVELMKKFRLGNIMKKLLCGLFGLVSVSAFAADFVNYQDRQVYANEANNACTGNTPDWVTLDIKVSDNVTGQEINMPQMKASGGVSCDNTRPKFRNRLNFGKSFGYYAGTSKSDKTEISFNDKVVIDKANNVVVRASLSDDPIFINGKQYSCDILGDKTVDSLGSANILLKCK